MSEGMGGKWVGGWVNDLVSGWVSGGVIDWVSD